ncbi:MAG: right-handed parallel beta-helix repeat-containing protein [Planctomycetales bacterium]|nr:right-handed parallel beta-helix repeat-containing protein [Planctomycetales bacterium]
MSRSVFGSTNRRTFLQMTAGLVAASTSTSFAETPDGRPPVTTPRATSGDAVVEPNWDERLTVTVGPAKADLVGTSEKVIQAAVDMVARFGGGTVKILPGTFRLRNSVYLASGIRLVGSGDETVLIKEQSVKTKLAADSDWYDQEITLADAAGFQVGDGVCLRTKNPHNGGPNVLKRTLIARSGKRFKLDRALRENFWQMGEPTAATLFPILSGDNISNVVIENLALDGNKSNNENLDGNYAGCIFLQDCSQFQIRGVTARHFNGDGISWQICHDVTVERCHSHDHTGLGLHPGSGSQRPLMRDNKLERNDIGLFFCWGVKYGLAEKNHIADNRGSGISIGHRDTDNIVRHNEVLRSGKVGILFRPERGQGFSGDRNLIEHNRVVDTGGDDGVGIDVQGFTSAIQLAKNEILETRQPAKRIGVRLGESVGKVALTDNRIEGFSQALTDLRKA